MFSYGRGTPVRGGCVLRWSCPLVPRRASHILKRAYAPVPRLLRGGILMLSRGGPVLSFPSGPPCGSEVKRARLFVGGEEMVKLALQCCVVKWIASSHAWNPGPYRGAPAVQGYLAQKETPTPLGTP